MAQAWQPTAADVQSIIPLRPTWTASTRPSLADVTATISRIADSVAAEFPALPVTLEPVARAHVAYRAASEVEGSYDPEQQFGGEDSQVARLDRAAGAELARLRGLGDSDIGGGGTAAVRGAFTIRPTYTTPV